MEAFRKRCASRTRRAGRILRSPSGRKNEASLRVSDFCGGRLDRRGGGETPDNGKGSAPVPLGRRSTDLSGRPIGGLCPGLCEREGGSLRYERLGRVGVGRIGAAKAHGGAARPRATLVPGRPDSRLPAQRSGKG